MQWEGDIEKGGGAKTPSGEFNCHGHIRGAGNHTTVGRILKNILR